MQPFDAIVAIISTVVLFLHALEGFSHEIKEAGEAKLRSILGSATKNRVLGFLLGAVFTAFVQSSSAVSSLAVALVDARALTFAASLAVVVGANVGTTATAWLVSADLLDIGPVFIAIGALLGIIPHRIRSLGKAVFYFGFIFFALDLVGQSLEPLKSSEQLPALLAYANNPFLGVFLGIVVTGVLQSSSVLTGLVILLVQQGSMQPEAAIAVIVGANLGSSTTALLASVKMDALAKRAALANAMLNGAGVLLFLPLIGLLTSLVTSWAHDVATGVALAHTLFNVVVALLALPFLGVIAQLQPAPLL